MRRIITLKQESFIRKNYPLKGSIFCGKVLNLNPKLIGGFCCRRGIKINESRMLEKNRENISHARVININKPHDKYHVHPHQFLNVTNPKIAYILGLWWADGYVRKQQISIENIECDLKELKKIFESIGTWSINYRRRKNRQPQMKISTNNKIVANYLIEHDYKSKSGMGADKILSTLPKELHHYWFRGLVDGDGCFYINRKNKCYQFSIASAYDQDWTYVEKIMIELKITYNITRRKQLQGGKINKSSVIRISNKSDIIKFGNYIYNNYKMDNIGLYRKYKKFVEISNCSMMSD